MTIRNALTTSILLVLLSACSAPFSDLKSPCVGINGSPCDHRPVNDWWLKHKENS